MRKVGLFLLLAAFAMSTLTISSVQAAETIKLTYSVFFPPTHGHAIAAVNMAKEIEKRTDGRVKITVFPGGTLTKPRVAYDGVVKGISDLALGVFAYTRGRFPMMEAIDLPYGYPNGRVATKVAWEYYKAMQPKELDDVKVLVIHAHGPGVLSAKKDVDTLEDVKGMKIRCTGLSAKIAAALGAAPVAMPQNQAYEALQKGVVEGTFSPIEVLKGWKQGEVIDYVIETAATGYTTAMYTVMNKKKYESLPADIKKVFDDVGEAWVDKHGKVWDDADVEGRKFVQELDRKIHFLPPDEEKKWVAAVQPLVNDYVTKTESKGLPGQKAVDKIRELLANQSK
jgi:TRAP-type C4-dicarboxylate transport system substrate-binding protein